MCFVRGPGVGRGGGLAYIFVGSVKGCLVRKPCCLETFVQLVTKFGLENSNTMARTKFKKLKTNKKQFDRVLIHL